MERIGGRIEADVASDRPARWPAGRAGRASSRAGSRAIRARPGARRRTSAWRAPSQSGPSRAVTNREAAGERSFTVPMLSCRLRCRRPSRGDSVDDALGRRPQGRSGSTIRSSPHRHPDHPHPPRRPPCGVPGCCSPWPRTTTTRRACPSPRRRSPTSSSTSRRASSIASNEIELARLGIAQARGHHLRPDPGRDARRHDRDRGQGLLDEPGLRPGRASSAPAWTPISGRPRGASTITQQLVRARLLPPAAFEGSTYERKIREIIQSIRLTEAYPGDAGKQDIITAYLNQNFYGNNLYGVQAAAKGYFGKDLKDLIARPVRDPGRHPAVPDDVRPGQERRGGLPRRPDRQRTPRTARRARWSSRPTARSSSAATGSSS